MESDRNYLRRQRTNTIRNTYMTSCSHNWELRRCRCQVVYALAKILASVVGSLVVDSEISWLSPLPSCLCLGKNPRPQCTAIAIAGVGNDLCELLCTKLDIQQDRAWRVDQMAMFFLSTLSAVGEFASGVLLHYVINCSR